MPRHRPPSSIATVSERRTAASHRCSVHTQLLLRQLKLPLIALHRLKLAVDAAQSLARLRETSLFELPLSEEPRPQQRVRLPQPRALTGANRKRRLRAVSRHPRAAGAANPASCPPCCARHTSC